uniref:Mannosyltransferase n=1 Tax=Glossina brevipalpis TaxID=37001 RepID=A0A1A9WGU7_9MUSC
MSPPAARQRYIANKNENNSLIKKPKKFINATLKREHEKSGASAAKINNRKHQKERPPENVNVVPSVHTAFKTFVSVRLCSAICADISDCDEIYNYWEPLHYIIYGQGLQTWEYSPQYALRSYTYILLQGVPGWIYERLFHPTPILIFYMVRCMLGFGCALMERFMYKSICQEFGVHIGRLWLIFQLFSAGMFISSTALLPSSFAMYFGCAALAAWWQQMYALSVFFVAIATLLGWPFAVLMGLPIAIDMLWRKHMFRTFFMWSAISAATICIPMVVIDSSYFGKLTFAPLNIVMYNVFTNHGPNLYGTEPWSYYIVNGFLNFNVIWLLSLLTPMMLIIDYIVVPAKTKSTLNFPRYITLAPFYLWLLVFIFQPHKEERFLFPIYPLISLCGAITVDVYQRIFYRVKTLMVQIKAGTVGSHYLDHTMFIAILVMLIGTLLGLSRVFALYRNYHAPMDLVMELNHFKNSNEYRSSRLYNVCVGKDWYRYPGSFFLPARNFRIRFLKSEFHGILPAYYADGENATRTSHSYFNDLNQENDYMYFPYENCHFLIDFDTDKCTSLEPCYSKRSKDWSVMKSLPFLIQEKSNSFFRAFYIPFLTDSYTVYGNFNLLKSKKMKPS